LSLKFPHLEKNLNVFAKGALWNRSETSQAQDFTPCNFQWIHSSHCGETQRLRDRGWEMHRGRVTKKERPDVT
jgi:hypothetical protein